MEIKDAFLIAGFMLHKCSLNVDGAVEGEVKMRGRRRENGDCFEFGRGFRLFAIENQQNLQA
jgi:hypothetical protein